MLKFTALESALIDQPKAPKRQGGEVNGDIKDLSDDEKKLIEILYKKPNMTAAEISTELAFSTRKISRLVKGLRESGVITRIGSNKNGYWQVNLGKKDQEEQYERRTRR